MPASHLTSLSRTTVQPLLRLALKEDGASRDITSRAVLSPKARIRAQLIAKATGVLAGGQVAAWTFQTLDPSVQCILKRRDGDRLAKGQTVLTVEGRARSIFAAERTALNLVGHLSGIATLTRTFMNRAGNRRVAILDTRKTLPGLRILEKHAVRAGGGQSHRAGLDDAILIKTNHLRVLRGDAEWTQEADRFIAETVRQAKRVRPKRFTEVEVSTLTEFKAALRAQPDAILLDNWAVGEIRKAVRLRNQAGRRPLLEVSGGVTLSNVRAIARTGVERISIGRLTHSAPSLDLALRVE